MLMLVAGLLQPARVQAYDPVSPPDWASQPGAVRHLYLFPSGSLTPAADESSNAFGSAETSIALGEQGTGWQDPDDPLVSPGEPGSGAWDLGKGPDGSVRITVPIGNAASDTGFGSYSVELKINAVGYVLFSALPLFSVDGYMLTNLTQSDSLAYPDPWIGNWKNRTWTASLAGVKEDRITLIVSAHPTSGSLVDTIEVYAFATIVPAEKTAAGTPVPWFQSFSIVPANGDDWDDADQYDSDGDGMLNWKEYAAGTNPTNRESLFKIVKIQAANGAAPHLEWIGGTHGSSAPYIIESTPSLSDPDWQPVGQRLRVDGTNDWTGTEALTGPSRYFRVIAPHGQPE
ncbi:MAG: hypothetical protein GX548_07830 [Lentisphaerae bacterium]|nr:hypothetical protein [Lentisphaerota bacterium]